MLENVDSSRCNNYWQTFIPKTDGDDLIYHLAGADYDVMRNPLNYFRLLNYRYRFSLEELLLRHFIKKFSSEYSRALDCGTGTGRNALALSNYFKWVDAFDLSQTFIATNKKRFNYKKNINFFYASFQELSISDSKYDLIFVGGVFMYMGDDEIKDALNLILRQLTKTGVLIIRDSISHENSQIINKVKIYRSLADYEKLFKANWELMGRWNGSGRNWWCSLFVKLPDYFRQKFYVYRVVAWLIKKTILLDYLAVLIRGSNYSRFASQMFSLYKIKTLNAN